MTLEFIYCSIIALIGLTILELIQRSHRKLNEKEFYNHVAEGRDLTGTRWQLKRIILKTPKGSIHERFN